MQTAANIAASAKSGMEKTKAVVQEKAEKMTTSDPLQKKLAEEKKEMKIHEAERIKLETRAQQEAAKHGHGYTTGTHAATTGMHGSTVPTGTGGVHTTGTGHTGLHDPRVL